MKQIYVTHPSDCFYTNNNHNKLPQDDVPLLLFPTQKNLA